MTESPRKNLRATLASDPNGLRRSRCFSCVPGMTHILLMNLSLLTGLPFLPLDSFGVSVHISFTFSRTMLQCLSNALTRASSFLLFRIEIRTWVWLRTAVWRIERGPAENSSVFRQKLRVSSDCVVGA